MPRPYCGFLGGLVLACTAVAPALGAQTADAPDSTTNPISASLVQQYEPLKDYIVKAAEEMPAADYGFKPTPKIRTFGQIVGHVADAEYEFCAGLRGVPNPEKNSAEKMTTKAQLVKTVSASFAYCDAPFRGARDAAMNDKVSMFGETHTRLYSMVSNISHANEHYGNMVIYLRLRGLVPPSSMPTSKGS
jgi:uncharacterized damage-inducible protein DinB